MIRATYEVSKRTVAIMSRRGMRRANARIQDKLAVSARAAAAGVIAEVKAKAKANAAGVATSVAVDQGAKQYAAATAPEDQYGWSFTSFFVSDATLNSIGSFVLEWNTAAVASKLIEGAINVTGEATATAVGTVSASSARRVRRITTRAANSAASVRRGGMSKKRFERFKASSGRYVDYALAVGESFATGGSGVAANAGATVAKRIAATAARQGSRATAQAYRQGMRQIVRREFRKQSRAALRAAA